jgi:hypothetical protein
MAGQTWPKPSSLAERDVAGVSTCTPLSLNPTPFFLRSQGPRMGYTSDPKVGVICRILFWQSEYQQQWLKGTQVRSIQNWGWNSCEDWFKWANQFGSQFFFACVLFFILAFHLVSSFGKNWGVVPLSWVYFMDNSNVLCNSRKFFKQKS